MRYSFRVLIDSSKTAQREKLLVLLLSLVQFSHVVDFVIMMPLGPQFMRIFNIGPSEFGLMVSSYTFSASVSGLIGAWFVDRFDRRNALVTMYLGFTLGTLFCALSTNHYYFVMGRIIAGAFGGILGAMVFSIIGDMIPEKRRGAATGKVMSAFALASILGVPLGLMAANKFTWRAPFFLLTGLSLVVLTIAFFALPSMKKHLSRVDKESKLQTFWEILFAPNHRAAYLLSAMLMMAAFSIIPYLSPFYVSNTGFLERDLGYVYLIGGAFTFFTSPYIGRISDQYGKYKVFSVTAFLSIFPIILVTQLGVSSPLLVLCSSTLFMVLISGRMVPAVAMITSSVRSEQRGGFMSINSSIQQFSMGLAAYWSGLIIKKTEEGKILNYELVGIFAAVSTILCIFIAKKVKTAKSAHASIDLEIKNLSGV